MAAPALQPAEPGELHPVLNVFFSPSAAMDSLARRPRFLLALLVITALAIVTMAIAFQRGAVEHSMRHKMESNPRFEQLPPERREAIIDQAARVSSYFAVGGAVLGPTIGLLLTSGVLLLLTNVVAGARVAFRQMMAVVVHSWLPLSIASLLGIPILLFKDPEAVDIQNVVPMANLSFLFSPTEQRRLYTIGSSIDLFSFWVIALLTLGLSRLTGKSKGSVLPLVLAPWVLYVLVFKVLLG